MLYRAVYSPGLFEVKSIRLMADRFTLKTTVAPLAGGVNWQRLTRNESIQMAKLLNEITQLDARPVH